MSGDDFAAWLAHMGYNIGDAATALGVGRNTVPRYAKEGAPRHIGLACAALARGMKEWRPK